MGAARLTHPASPTGFASGKRCVSEAPQVLRPGRLTPRARVAHGCGVRCHGCGAERELAASERIGFREACESCDRDLHVCLNCRFHDPSAYNECRESNAERVGDRDRANRCDYFSAGDRGGPGVADEQGAARSPLDALFKKP